jgi:D-alanyl-lipoteichoic acid acyltransferase DltB (MBOAT superfamily)
VLFNSVQYLLLLTSVALVFWQCAPRGRRILLLLASYVFYAGWDAPWSTRLIAMGLVVGSTLANYALGLLVAPHRPARRIWMTIAVVVNIGVLCLFKYDAFISDTLAHVVPWHFTPWKWTLPLGISFFTFEVISYVADVYRGATEPMEFFPHLIAGPIIRSRDLAPQLSLKHDLDWEQVRTGVARFIWGMAKKIFVADVMAKVVKEYYGDVPSSSGLALWLATYAFAVQIYCDFSAYSDMAIGSALILGIRLPENFDMPYLSCSIREFWRRWHISLSTWLRDYLYIPLGGSRAGTVRLYVNLMITMLLGGLWHGAAWSFVAWGGFQGFMMCAERLSGMNERPPENRAWRATRWFVTFQLTCVSWVMFRAADGATAWTILKKIVTLAPGRAVDPLPVDWRPLVFLAMVLLADVLDVKRSFIEMLNERPVLARWVGYGAAAIFVLTFARASNNEFVYFQF